MAERLPALVRRCRDAGHEIASHGYGHVLAYEVGPERFGRDAVRAKQLLEDLAGQRVRGFRAPGFGVTRRAPWAFDLVRAAGYQYDSSVFPASRGHGGLSGSPLGPYLIHTPRGALAEIPTSVVERLGRRWCLFGGGYLRLAPRPLIRWGMQELRRAGRPAIIYLHPREIDPEHPRLPLSRLRRFKCYVNLKSTWPKLQWLCRNHDFVTLKELVEQQWPSLLDDRERLLPSVPPGPRKVA
jgi:polysaccharide deacetylase family protein (PEP-CTERM system associated)